MKITKGNFSCTKGQLTIRGTEYRPEGNKLPAVILSHGFNGIGGDLADLLLEILHQVAAQEDQLLTQAKVNLLPLGPEVAAHPVGQLPLALTDKIHRRTALFMVCASLVRASGL